jgi:hypothetical protein
LLFNPSNDQTIRKEKPMGLAQVSISTPTQGASFTNGASVTASGTFTGTMNDVLFIYVDASGAQQKIATTVTTSGGDWSASSVTLPLNDWRYMVCARAYNSSDQSKAADDHAISCGSPAP